MRPELSFKWIKSGTSGIEIGGLHFPLPVAPRVSVTYVDLDPENDHSDQKSVHKYIVDNAETLGKFHDESQDFVIANHVLEHCEDTLGTLQTWMRVLKPGGIAYIALPSKDHCFDRRRAVTTWEHFLIEHNNPGCCKASRFAHYMDWFRNSELELCDEATAHKKSAAALAGKQNIHWHTYTVDSMRDMFGRAASMLGFSVLEDRIHGSEVIWVLKKQT